MHTVDISCGPLQKSLGFFTRSGDGAKNWYRTQAFPHSFFSQAVREGLGTRLAKNWYRSCKCEGRQCVNSSYCPKLYFICGRVSENKKKKLRCTGPVVVCLVTMTISMYFKYRHNSNV